MKPAFFDSQELHFLVKGQLWKDAVHLGGKLPAVKHVRADVEGVNSAAAQNEDHAQVGGEDDGMEGFFGAGGEGVDLCVPRRGSNGSRLKICHIFAACCCAAVS